MFSKCNSNVLFIDTSGGETRLLLQWEHSHVQPEAVAWRCPVKKVFLEISQIHRETPVPEPLF